MNEFRVDSLVFLSHGCDQKFADWFSATQSDAKTSAPASYSVTVWKMVSQTHQCAHALGSCNQFSGHGHPSAGVNNDESRVYAVCFRRIIFRGDR